MYLLDTNICIYLIREKSPKIEAKFRSHSITEVGISSITFSELQFGVEKSQYPEKNQEALNFFLAPLEIFPFDERAAIAYGKIRAKLEKQGNVTGPLDLMICSHALALYAILVTNNVKEFPRVKNLKIENWA